VVRRAVLVAADEGPQPEGELVVHLLETVVAGERVRRGGAPSSSGQVISTSAPVSSKGRS